MFCTNCGFINPTDAHYCQSCGHHFQMQTVSIPAPAITSPAPTDSETPEVADLNQETNIKVQQPNFLVKHWRGDYSLGFSYWVIGSLLTIVVVAIATAVGSMKEMQEFGPRASGFIILAFYGFALPLTLWQLVGIWRSADKHGQRSGKSFWANLAKISVLLGFLRTDNRLSLLVGLLRQWL